MDESTPVSFGKPSELTKDLLTEFAREGARQMLAAALEDEVETFVSERRHLKRADGKARVVRNGYLPKRAIQTGIGEIAVKVPRTRDRGGAGEETPFISSLIPKYLRKSGQLEECLPLLYLHGLSSNNFRAALSPIFGERAANLAPSTIHRLRAEWSTQYEAWQKRDLSAKQYVYWWVDGIHVKSRLEEPQCLLVMIGVRPDGAKELLAIHPGYRESKASWRELLIGLRERGLKAGPKLAIGDGALGFWAALSEVFPKTLQQRCWFHKMGNVLDKLPTSQQGNAKRALQAIWMAGTREEAHKAFDTFVKIYEAKYPKAADCLRKDKRELLAFYDFPAEHWQHLRTTNPIESLFATVRHRTSRVKNCYSANTLLAMTFKLCQSAEKRWRRLRGFRRLEEVASGVKFINGISEQEANESAKKLEREDAA